MPGCGTLGVPVDSSTVLGLVMALPDPPVTAGPEVTGVDDFALRKGRVLVSRTLDRHAAVLDLLQAGRSRREAAEILGLSRKTVNRFAPASPASPRCWSRPPAGKAKPDPNKA